MMKPEIFQRQAVCPVCGSVSRSRAEDGLARDKKPSYLLALAGNLKIPYDEVVGPLRDWKCESCTCVYLDPSLSHAAASRLYHEVAPIHNAGWSAFTQKLLGEPAGEKYLDVLKNCLVKESIRFDKYLEVGCPFSGLSLALVGRDQVRQEFPKTFVDQNRYPDATMRRILRHGVRIQRVLKRIAAVYFQIWLWLHDRRRAVVAETEVPVTAARELSFLAEFSCNRWSVDCRAFGSSCVNMARNTLGTSLISIGQLRSLPNSYFELAGIFNSLDHSDSPIELLDLVARKSRYVLVTVHTLKDAHLQHRFAFSSATIPRVCSQLGLRCRDLSDELGKYSDVWMAYLIESET